MLSRQEELKERARVLLEQARRDADIKAGNKQNTSAATALSNRQLSDVRNIGLKTNHKLFIIILGARGVIYLYFC